ncbi:sulfatase [Puniceicoccaceae bacterium K14]|nr:sulfatase [Puniceicoccaceae bacterium K14]
MTKSLLTIFSFFLFSTQGFAIESVPSEVVPDFVKGASPRNVVFILSDDHRYDAMSFLGHQFAQTPEMDKLAESGVHLKNAFVTTSLCSPSRASILTGLYTFRHRVIDNQKLVPEGTIYFPQYLQEAGYSTAFIGKWHMGQKSDEPRPGFDHWVSFRGQGHYLPPDPDYTLNVNGDRVKQKGYITDELTNYAVDWLKKQENSDTPFFLYLSHKAVHANFTPAERHVGDFEGLPFERPKSEARVDDEIANTPRWLRDQRNSWHGVDFPYHSELDIEDYYKRYCETLSGVDDSIGRVMTQLEDMGILEETLVIYMGDNGFMFGEHGLIDKRVAYETSIRVPMLMSCPELFEGGTVVDEMAANIDIAPTVLEAMGLQKPIHMDGESLIPLSLGKAVSWRENFLYVYYWEKNFPHSPTVFALRNDRYKLINYYGLWDVDELYDLQNDPTESNNLIYDSEYETIAKNMTGDLYDMMDRLGGMEIPINPPSGTFENKRLRSRSGKSASPFPEALVVEEPIHQHAQ